jgi:hypothetical protein
MGDHCHRVGQPRREYIMRSLIIAIAAALAVCVIPAVAGTGVITSTGYGSSQLDACNMAKADARGVATLDAARYGSIANVRITGYSPCTCEASSALPSEYDAKPVAHWKCSVDANYSS